MAAVPNAEVAAWQLARDQTLVVQRPDGRPCTLCCAPLGVHIEGVHVHMPSSCCSAAPCD